MNFHGCQKTSFCQLLVFFSHCRLGKCCLLFSPSTALLCLKSQCHCEEEKCQKWNRREITKCCWSSRAVCLLHSCLWQPVRGDMQQQQAHFKSHWHRLSTENDGTKLSLSHSLNNIDLGSSSVGVLFLFLHASIYEFMCVCFHEMLSHFFMRYPFRRGSRKAASEGTTPINWERRLGDGRVNVCEQNEFNWGRKRIETEICEATFCAFKVEKHLQMLEAMSIWS